MGGPYEYLPDFDAVTTTPICEQGVSVLVAWTAVRACPRQPPDLEAD